LWSGGNARASQPILGSDSSSYGVGQKCPSCQIKRDDAANADEGEHHEDYAEDAGVNAGALGNATGDAADNPVGAAVEATATN